jgi:hypothetical protein
MYIAIIENYRKQAVDLIKIKLFKLRLLLFICGFEEELQSFMRFIGVIEDVLVYCHHFIMTNEWMVKNPS